jgi:hypothetical protein
VVQTVDFFNRATNIFLEQLVELFAKSGIAEEQVS